MPIKAAITYSPVHTVELVLCFRIYTLSLSWCLYGGFGICISAPQHLQVLLGSTVIVVFVLEVLEYEVGNITGCTGTPTREQKRPKQSLPVYVVYITRVSAADATSGVQPGTAER